MSVVFCPTGKHQSDAQQFWVARQLKHGSGESTTDSRLELGLRAVRGCYFSAFLALPLLCFRIYDTASSLILFWDKNNCEDATGCVWTVCNYVLTQKEKIAFLLPGSPRLQEQKIKSAHIQAKIIEDFC